MNDAIVWAVIIGLFCATMFGVLIYEGEAPRNAGVIVGVAAACLVALALMI